MPMPTTSPAAKSAGSTWSSVSSTRCGSPQREPVAAARTYSQRGVMTATPNDKSLGLIRCTRGPTDTSSRLLGRTARVMRLLEALAIVGHLGLGCATRDDRDHQRTHALPASQLPFAVDLKSGAIAVSPGHVRLSSDHFEHRRGPGLRFLVIPGSRIRTP